jgi:hypothetical protein
MSSDIKDDVKRIAKETEVKLTGFLLRWKDQADGKEIPDPEAIDRKSRIIAEKANEILKRRGKTILKEIKNVYIKKQGEEDKND